MLSEDSYIKALQEIIRTYLVPFKFLGIVPVDAIEKVFLNVEQIESVHREIQASLRPSSSGDARELSDSLVAVFKAFADRLKVYSVYIAGFEGAADELRRWEREEPEVAAFLEERKTKHPEGLPLAALLIQPVQRICRYPLLFGEALKNTSPTHPDYESIREALEQLEHVTHWINDEKRKEFNAHRMQQLEAQVEGFELDLVIPGRHVIWEGTYRVAEAVGMDPQTFKVILFNDSLFWLRPLKKSTESFKYEGHVMFDRVTRTERTGLDLVRLENQTMTRFIQCKDLLATEHLHTILSEAVTTRAEFLKQVHKKRADSAKNEKDRLFNKLSTMEKELEYNKRLVEAQAKKIAAWQQWAATLPSSEPIPAELLAVVSVPASEDTTPRNALLTSMSRSKNLSPSPKMTHMNAMLTAEMAPTVVLANEDFLSEDPEELSFSFGELLLLVQDLGDYFLGRPLEGEVFTEKRVQPHMVSLTVKKGNNYVRSIDLGGGGGGGSGGGGSGSDKIGRDKKSGNFLLDVARATLRPESPARTAKPARASNDVLPQMVGSPSFRKKTLTSSRNSAAQPTRDSDGMVELAPGVPDHSQEVMLKQGWLRKLGGVRKNWKRRFFFLSESHLYYYENDKIAGKKPLGVLALSDVYTVERSKKFDDGFNVPSPDRMWEFRGESPEEANDWIVALDKLIKKRVKDTVAQIVQTKRGRRVSDTASKSQEQDQLMQNPPHTPSPAKSNSLVPLTPEPRTPSPTPSPSTVTVAAAAAAAATVVPEVTTKEEDAFDQDVYDL